MKFNEIIAKLAFCKTYAEAEKLVRGATIACGSVSNATKLAKRLAELGFAMSPIKYQLTMGADSVVQVEELDLEFDRLVVTDGNERRD